ncbi:MAG: oxygen-independent coproporphyrinogen III oxidase [Fulvivirga sp.]|uniref:oxygen-independent coproporphyrinogen III oxidase n=1 Tax=Fulvivirga sp. TaxID=1931237 RepID=UPI0032EF5C2F
MKIPEELIEKYNVPAPRYTSYPTVPYWEEEKLNESDWLSVVKQTFNESNQTQGISLYVHLPYCESLCTYCACNTRITKNHAVEDTYINAVLAEWDIYIKTFEQTPILREVHLGGGTPTFFSPENLNKLLSQIYSKSLLHPLFECSFEGHPNNTNLDHLEVLYNLGSRRVSFGVQDLNFKVQKTINRVQPFENVLKATEDARKIGFKSVNFDLIYGLPFQTVTSVKDTIASVIQLKPERIAFYSYAHVPWKRPGQRAYTEADLPDNSYKRELYEEGKKLLTDNGYIDVGMDHFALPNDPLYKAYQTKSMHRNFMGYTHATTDLLIGLGSSAVSDAKYAYAQNAKHVEDYKEKIGNGKLALEKGHFLSDEDLLMRKIMLEITCNGELCWTSTPNWLTLNMLIQLNTMHEEGLLRLYPTGFRLTDLGMAFLRNICMVFDKRLTEFKSEQQMFSKAI